MGRDPESFLENSAQQRADNPSTPTPAKAKAAPAPKAPATSAGTGALPPEANSGPSADAGPLAKAGGPSFSVSAGGIYSFSDTDAQKVADVTLAPEDAEKILKASGAVYDEHRETYDNVPEAAIKLLRDGPQSLGASLKEQFGIGLAEFHRSSLAVKMAKGEISAEDFRQRTQPDLVKMQFERHPAAAWHGLGDAISDFVRLRHEGRDSEALAGLVGEAKNAGKDLANLPRQSLGEAAKALPQLADIFNKATVGTVVGGTAAAALGPEAIPLGMKLGGAVGSFLSLYHQELGGRMAALADRGLPDADIKKQAPVEAVKSAVGAGVFLYGVDAMTMPLRARFLKGLAESPEASKVMSSWAHEYGMNAGIKMPSLGAVHQVVSDLMDNLSAIADHRPDLIKPPLQISDNAIEAAAGMGRLGLTAGIPGAIWEAGGQALDRRAQAAADAKLAAEVGEKLKGFERREPAPAAAPSPSASSESPSGERTPAQSSQTASEGPLSETRQAPAQTPPPKSGDLSSPYPTSVTEHPAFVKAVESAKGELPPGVDPHDRTAVVKSYIDASQESHDYNGVAMQQFTDAKLGKITLTPDEKTQISARVLELVTKMSHMRDLAQFAVDPEGEAVWRDWGAAGREGPEPLRADDPYNAWRDAQRAEKAKAAAAAEEAAAKKLDDTLANKDAKPGEVVAAASAASERLGEKVQGAKVDARAEAVKSDLEDLRQRIGEIASTRDRLQANGLSTRALDRQLNTLVDEAVSAQKELEKLEKRDPSELEVSKRAKLQMKPATLDDIVNIGFKEGGKQSQERARELLKIAQDNGLTATDVKKLVGNKAPGAMGDVAYRNFLEGFERASGEEGKEPTRVPGFREGVAKLVERKKARAEVAAVLQEKQIEKEQYVRQLNNLPAFSKMTTEQLKSYADILRGYDKGDTALAPKRIEALKGTMLEGVKTEGEARQKVAELTGRPVEDFKNVRVPLVARAIPDPQLREWFPALRPFVDLAGETADKGERLAETVRGRNEELAAAAIRERRAKMGLGERVADFFAPQQRGVMDYLEAKVPADVAAAAEKLTPAELKWANFLKAWFGTAEDYLVKKDGMTTRFSGSYAPHVNRGWPEILRELKEQGLWSSLKEFMPQANRKTGDFVDAQGNVLGFNKFFKQTMFRSGELEPSKNVVSAANHYISDFYRKAALDQIAPVLDTLARAMKAPPEETGLHPTENQALTSSLQDFVKAYVNNKKGINNSAGAVGELLAPALRGAQTLAAIHYIAGNYALQAIKGAVAIPVSEYMVLGTDLFKAKALKYTEQGKAILAKYESFTGKSPWEEIKAPGADARDFASAATYGGFGFAHKVAMEDLLLGSMTKEEFAAGTISDARLNEIRQHAGRWMDLSRSDSIMGSSAPGKSFTQYKGWAIPPTLTLAEDARALARAVTGKGKLNEVQVREAMRLAALAAVAATGGAIYSKDDEDDTYRGQAIHYFRRALGSVWRGLDPAFFFSAAGLGYVAKLAADLHLLDTLERDKNDELKGAKALKRDLTPRLVKDVLKLSEED